MDWLSSGDIGRRTGLALVIFNFCLQSCFFLIEEQVSAYDMHFELRDDCKRRQHRNESKRSVSA